MDNFNSQNDGADNSVVFNDKESYESRKATIYAISDEAEEKEKQRTERKNNAKRTAIKAIRYVGAVIVFLISYFLSSAIIYLLLHLLQVFTPRAYKSSELWISIITYAAVPCVTNWLVNLVSDDEKFTFVMSIIGASITLLLIGGNLVIGFDEIQTAINLSVMAISYIIFTVKIGKEL